MGAATSPSPTPTPQPAAAPAKRNQSRNDLFPKLFSHHPGRKINSPVLRNHFVPRLRQALPW